LQAAESEAAGLRGKLSAAATGRRDDARAWAAAAAEIVSAATVLQSELSAQLRWRATSPLGARAASYAAPPPLPDAPLRQAPPPPLGVQPATVEWGMRAHSGLLSDYDVAAAVHAAAASLSTGATGRLTSPSRTRLLYGDAAGGTGFGGGTPLNASALHRSSTMGSGAGMPSAGGYSSSASGVPSQLGAATTTAAGAYGMRGAGAPTTAAGASRASSSYGASAGLYSGSLSSAYSMGLSGSASGRGSYGGAGLPAPQPASAGRSPVAAVAHVTAGGLSSRA
jgi:hypothetical protein